jgi:acetylornithine deacetylase/succinyl-diaminopimelate desuccinylase-like protein
MTTPSWLESLDWEAVQEEALDLLVELLRVDTTNPPGREAAACAVIADVLEREGIDHEVFEVAPGRANLVARVTGDGSAEPLMLSSHLDVVSAEEGAWTHPPFGGEVHDGYIWGRGALDMKNMTAMGLACLLAIHRHARSQLRRDVILTAVADEEAGCELGSLWLALNHPDKVRAEYVFGEIGGFTLHLGESRFCPVQVAEKGVCWLRIRVQGEGGHGSIPRPNTPMERIAEAAVRLSRATPPLIVTDVMRHFVDEIARRQPFPRGAVLRMLLNPATSRLILEKVMPDPNQALLFHSLLHDTATPTVLNAGDKVNVIPPAAELLVDGRTLPGRTADDLVAQVRDTIGDGFEIEVTRFMPAVDGPVDDPVIAVIQEVLDELDPGVVAVPNLIPGFTDAKAWASLGSTCIGFSPLQLGPDDVFSALFHGVDERIPVAGFNYGVRALTEVVARVVS